MLLLKHVTKSRAFLFPLFTLNSPLHNLISTTYCFSSSANPSLFSAPRSASIHGIDRLTADEVADSFKDWFRSRNNALFDKIYEILGTQLEGKFDQFASHCATDLALSQLGLQLSEEFVLEVLNYGEDVLSCLKFFDWAGRQRGFNHTRATFHAILKILSRSKLMSLMLDFLQNFTNHRYEHKVRFNDILVMGYAVAGKPEVALQLFGRMRFKGLDLDSFAYHVLLNALVEENCFDVVEVIVKQIQIRNYENDITRAIMIKSLCKQKRLDEAESFLNGLLSSGKVLNGHEVSVLVDALCKNEKFERAGKLVGELQDKGLVPMERAYGLWIKHLIRAGGLDRALEFLQDKKTLEGYVPDVFRYNILISRLLRENRLEELCDLLLEMKKGHIVPDKVTMNASLCFFCKAGMVDIALELYNSRSEFGLSPNSMAYNYLINTLCGDGSIDEAYHVLRNSIHQGYFPGRKTFSILADALCREGKLDKMKELVIVALENDFMPSAATYDKFISALCRARRVEDGYLIHEELNKINKVATRNTYLNLIHGFNKSNRGDIAARLLIEMQEKGHTPTRTLYIAVICCLCDMENPEIQFSKLLEMQLSRREATRQMYNSFINGAGHAKKPELARQVYEMMRRNGIQPDLNSELLTLRSYLKSEKISDALSFFNYLRERRKIGRKLYNCMVIGLCKIKRSDVALEFLREMRGNGVTPSIECYENLVQLLCSRKSYLAAVDLINDYEKIGRSITSFLCNIFLLHSLGAPEIYDAWVHLRGEKDRESSRLSTLGLLIGAFSGRIKVNQHLKSLEDVIEKCFPLDTYTYNMLLRRLSMNEMDSACELFNRMCQKGYEPNRWTYDIIVHGFFKHGRTSRG
ncbi:Pentatricopeptide repeat-containing protein [Quillaja saponaria]|uniref:Pentatricopeptide repeat-containing protein n=1 Tax=Quillaja saponaria TaxID=32244 RepID=A0AAD7PLR4_QUISA|nr:Pentatricopeptide repeat-containing protein [Quillaja saponaria]